MLDAPELTRVVLRFKRHRKFTRSEQKNLLQMRVDNVGNAREFGNLKEGKLSVWRSK